MAEAKTESKKAPKVNEYGQTEEQYKEAHDGRSEEAVPEDPASAVDEGHAKAKKEARWG